MEASCFTVEVFAIATHYLSLSVNTFLNPITKLALWTNSLAVLHYSTKRISSSQYLNPCLLKKAKTSSSLNSVVQYKYSSMSFVSLAFFFPFVFPLFFFSSLFPHFYLLATSHPMLMACYLNPPCPL